MGRSWRIGVDVQEKTDLVTDGLFRYARNPIYSFMTAVGLSSFAAAPNAATAAGAAMLAGGVELQVRLVEEPHLRATHLDTYTAYARRTGRFVPQIGKLR
jgi:protein-S-isoprenylcysteine O-methyltransferase Ste14